MLGLSGLTLHEQVANVLGGGGSLGGELAQELEVGLDVAVGVSEAGGSVETLNVRKLGMGLDGWRRIRLNERQGSRRLGFDSRRRGGRSGRAGGFAGRCDGNWLSLGGWRRRSWGMGWGGGEEIDRGFRFGGSDRRFSEQAHLIVFLDSLLPRRLGADGGLQFNGSRLLLRRRRWRGRGRRRFNWSLVSNKKRGDIFVAGRRRLHERSRRLFDGGWSEGFGRSFIFLNGPGRLRRCECRLSEGNLLGQFDTPIVGR